ncbi:uncharacterized protein LOC111138425 isoform X3 [Crassostrea virginica]|uniref:Uncharacterized protein LOC111138425 isoform X1 n=1 Tax=Crassostrea virginica TaxID=6565 RepID=A0A8B8F1I2_CRAVI|nr:uncharacterized protein LOC111138425 isoform X1 [Crassostrea virginica]
MCSCCCRRSSKYKYIYIGTNGNAGLISTSVSSGLDPHRRDNFFSGNVWILVIKDYQISKKKTHMFKSERYVLLERRSFASKDIYQVMTMDTSYLQSCLCSLHIPTIQCPNSQCNEQANAGIKRIKDQHSYHRCKPQPIIQSSSSFDCG